METKTTPIIDAPTPTLDPKNFDVYDYLGGKFSYEREKNYGKWAEEELWGLNYQDIDSKQDRKQKHIDNLFLTMLAIIYTLYLVNICRNNKQVIKSFAERVHFEGRDSHLEKKVDM